jgi:hypothetical protein
MGLFGFGGKAEVPYDARQGGEVSSIGKPADGRLPYEAGYLPDSEADPETPGNVLKDETKITSKASQEQIPGSPQTALKKNILEAARSLALAVPDSADGHRPDASGSGFDRFRAVPLRKERTTTKILKALTLTVSLSALAPSISFAKDSSRRSTLEQAGINARENFNTIILREISGFPKELFRKVDAGLDRQKKLDRELHALIDRYNNEQQLVVTKYAAEFSLGKKSVEDLDRRKHTRFMNIARSYDVKYRNMTRSTGLPLGVGPKEWAKEAHARIVADYEKYLALVMNDGRERRQPAAQAEEMSPARQKAEQTTPSQSPPNQAMEDQETEQTPPDGSTSETRFGNSLADLAAKLKKLTGKNTKLVDHSPQPDASLLGSPAGDRWKEDMKE